MNQARTRLLAGNWKMHKSNAELATFFRDFAEAAKLEEGRKVEVLFAVPYTLLERAQALAASHGIRIAAQNVHWEAQGAFTGEISLAMLADIGITATLIGHSERRQYFAETDATVARKVKAARAARVTPIVCVGETLAERDAGKMAEVVRRQLTVALEPCTSLGDLVIAYEPVWAIGTGRSASAAQAQEVHHLIRSWIAERFDRAAADQLRILYGGSANPANIDELLAQPDVDGALVGGASLKAADFAAMVRSGGKGR